VKLSVGGDQAGAGAEGCRRNGLPHIQFAVDD